MEEIQSPWDHLEKHLNLVYVRYNSKLEIDWEDEIDLIRNICIRGMSINSPFVMPKPGQDKYPPFLILNQAKLWLSKIFPLNKKESPISTSPFLSDSRLRDYFLSLLNIMGFLLHEINSAESDRVNFIDEDDDEDDEDDDEGNDIGEPQSDKSIVNGTISDDHTQIATVSDAPQVEIGQIHSTTTTNDSITVASTTDQNPVELSPYDPLSELAADIYYHVVTAAMTVLNESKSQNISLYDKYKSKMVGNESADITEVIEILLSRFTPPFAEIFGPCLKARESLRKRDISCAAILRNHAKPPVKMIYQLANTIDEDCIILHIQEKKGYKVHISACSDNRILGIAIAASLIQAPEDNSEGNLNLLKGERPPKEILELLKSTSPQMLPPSIQWSHPFTFSNWTAIQPDGSAPSGMGGASHWLWQEGSPTEILKWNNNQRIIILGKAPFPRKFSPIRIFAGLNPTVKLLHVLSHEELSSLIQSISQTEESIRTNALLTLKTLTSGQDIKK